MNILLEFYPAPCRHVRILDAATGNEVEVTTLDELQGAGSLAPASLAEQARALLLNASPFEVGTTAGVKTFLEAKSFTGVTAVGKLIGEVEP